MAAGVAHEISNPLTSVKGFLQLMQNEADKPDYTDLMLSEVNHIETIVKEFLALAKPQTIKRSSTDLNVLLEDIVTFMNTQAIMKNIQLIKEADDELPPLHCDDHQIKRAFIHILQNAVEATSNGGAINIQAMKYGSSDIKVTFTDQGCGISEDRIKRIGEPFYCIKEKGTGLGLMISHKIIQEYGGIIHLQSTINQGTTVEVVLPIKHSLIRET